MSNQQNMMMQQMNLLKQPPQKDVGFLLTELNQQYEIIMAAMKKVHPQSATMTKEQIQQHIMKAEELINTLTLVFKERNILGLPTDYDIQNMATNLKKNNDSLKQNLNHATTSASIISKAFMTDLPINR